MEHTKGPWEVRDVSQAWMTILGNEQWNGDKAIIGTVLPTEHPFMGRTPEQLANGRLIAAAPELLEACHRVTQQLLDLHAAIVDQHLEGCFVDDSIDMLSEGRTAIEHADAAICTAEEGDSRS